MANKDKEVETKVVQLDLDNRQFNKDVDTTTNKVEKLDQAVRMKGADKDVNKVTAAFKTLLDGMIFRVGQKIIDKITISVKSMVNTMAGVQNITNGWSRYEEQLTTVGGIANNIQNQFKDIVDTEERMKAATEAAYVAMEQLQWYTDETSFSFQTLSQGIQQFTTAGIELEEATSAAMGVTSLAGSSKVFDGNKIQSAMNAVAKALQTGYMDTQKWTTLTETAGIVTTEFSQALLEEAAAQGKLIKSAAGQYKNTKGQLVTASNIRSTLSSKWLTGDILEKVLGQYSSAGETIYEVMQQVEEGTASSAVMLEMEAAGLDKNTMTAAAMIPVLQKAGYTFDEMSLAAFKSSQETSTFAQALSAIKDAVTTNWQGIFQSIFGQVGEATNLWGEVNTQLYEVFVGPMNALSDMFDEWSVLEEGAGGAQDFRNAIVELVQIIGKFKEAISEAFSEVFGEFGVDALKSITLGIKNFTSNLLKNEQAFDTVKTIFKVLATAIKAVGKVFTTVGKIIKTVFESVEPIINIVLNLVTTVSNAVLDFGEIIKNSEILKYVEKQILALLGLTSLAEKAKEGLIDLGETMSDFWQKIINSEFVQKVIGWFKTLGEYLSTLWSEEIKPKYFKDALTTIRSFYKLIKLIFAFKIFKTAWKFIAGWFNIKEAIVDLFDSSAKYFKAKKFKELSYCLVGISASIALLIGAAKLLETVDWSNLIHTFLLFIGFIAIYVTLLAILAKISKAEIDHGVYISIPGYIGAAVGLAILVTTLTALSFALTYINWGSLFKGIILVGVAVAAIAAVATSTSRYAKISGKWTKSIKEFSMEGKIGQSFFQLFKYILLLAAMIGLIYGALLLVGKWEKFNDAQITFLIVLASIFILIAAIVMIVRIAGKQGVLSNNNNNKLIEVNGLSMFGLALSLAILVAGISMFLHVLKDNYDENGKFKWSSIWGSIVLIGSVIIGMVLLSLFLKVFDKSLKKNTIKNILGLAVSFGIICIGLGIIVWAMKAAVFEFEQLMDIAKLLAIVIVAVGVAFAIAEIPLLFAKKATKKLTSSMRGLALAMIGMSFLLIGSVAVIWFCNTQLDSYLKEGETLKDMFARWVDNMSAFLPVIISVGAVIALVSLALKNTTNAIWGFVALIAILIGSIIAISLLYENNKEGMNTAIVIISAIASLVLIIIVGLSHVFKTLKQKSTVTEIRSIKTFMSLLILFTVMIGIISGLVIAMSFMNTEKLWNGYFIILVITALVLIIVVGLSHVFKTLKQKITVTEIRSIKTFISLLIVFTVMIGVISGLIIAMSFMNTEKLWNGYFIILVISALIVAIGFAAIGMGLIVKKINKKNILTGIGIIFIMVTIITAMVGLLYLINTMIDAGTVWNSVLVMSSLVGLIAITGLIIALLGKLASGSSFWIGLGAFAAIAAVIAGVVIGFSYIISLINENIKNGDVWKAIQVMTALVALVLITGLVMEILGLLAATPFFWVGLAAFAAIAGVLALSILMIAGAGLLAEKGINVLTSCIDKMATVFEAHNIALFSANLIILGAAMVAAAVGFTAFGLAIASWSLLKSFSPNAANSIINLLDYLVNNKKGISGLNFGKSGDSIKDFMSDLAEGLSSVIGMAPAFHMIASDIASLVQAEINGIDLTMTIRLLPDTSALTGYTSGLASSAGASYNNAVSGNYSSGQPSNSYGQNGNTYNITQYNTLNEGTPYEVAESTKEALRSTAKLYGNV